MYRWKIAAVILLAVLLTAGCASKKTISRIDTNETVDLSGQWNDTDSRLVSESMISDALRDTTGVRPWLGNFLKAKGKNPTVIVYTIQNKTDEHIATETFIGDIERAFINSGSVNVVSAKSERDAVRDERQDQQANASPETMKKFGEELGADYMLMGRINKIADAEGREAVSFYQVDLYLTDLQTNQKVWAGQKKIKKFIAQKPYKP
jgi:uncharacterized protein (TIGR02722 family)